MEFKQLKNYFETNELPESLDCADFYVKNVKFTVDLLINQIDVILSKGKPTEHALIQKQKLLIIYRALQDKKNWNVSFYDMNKNLF